MEGGLKTWDDIETFDDIVSPAEKEIISRLEAGLSSKCPHLQKEGDFFYYCGLKISEVKDRKPEYSSPIYQRHVGVAELQLHCMSDFEACCFQSGQLRR